jgi:hypothetical protein
MTIQNREYNPKSFGYAYQSGVEESRCHHREWLFFPEENSGEIMAARYPSYPHLL